MQMDANLRHRRNLLNDDVTEAVYMKIHSCLEYSGEPLHESLSRSDFDNSGTILLSDLTRVMKRIGISNVEAHLPLILKSGGASITDERIDIESFSEKLTREVTKRVKAKSMIKEKFLRKLHSLLTTKGLTLFDFFMRLDVNRSSTLTKTEMKTGM